MRKLLLAIVLSAGICASAHAGWEIVARPGIDFFGDGVGFTVSAGVQTGELLKSQNENFEWLTSVDFLFTTANVSDILVRDLGFNLGLGYAWSIGNTDLRLTPRVYLGAAHGLVDVFGVEAINGWGLLITPALSFDLPLKVAGDGGEWVREHMRLGLNLGYSFTINTEIYHHLVTELAIIVRL